MSGMTTNLKPIKKAYGVGIGQSYANLTSSRSTGVNYTNTKGKTITVLITGAGGDLIVDGLTVGRLDSAGYNVVSAPVGNNSSYRLTGGAVYFWVELG